MTMSKSKFKKAVVIAFAIAAVALLSEILCIMRIAKTVESNLEYSEIALVKLCANYSWGAQETVHILTSDGTLYFDDDLMRDYGEKSIYGDDVHESLTEYVLSAINENKSVYRGEERPEILNTLITLTDYESIDLKLHHSACDMGTTSYYVLLIKDDSAKLIEMKKTGDYSSVAHNPIIEIICMTFDMTLSTINKKLG